MKNLIRNIVITTGIVLVLISLGLNVCDVIVNKESIVLTFVGILATFVVVTNYAQVIEIQNNTTRQIEQMEQRFLNQIEELNKMQTESENRINSRIQELNKMELRIDNVSNRITDKDTQISTIEKIVQTSTIDLNVLIGSYLTKSDSIQKSITYLIGALSHMFDWEIGSQSRRDSIGLNILKCIKDEKWITGSQVKIDYNLLIDTVSNFPKEFNYRTQIVDELLLRQKESEVRSGFDI